MSHFTPLQRICTVGAATLVSVVPLVMSAPAVAAETAIPTAKASIASPADVTATADLVVQTTSYRLGDRLIVTGTAAPSARIGVQIAGTTDYVIANASADGTWTTTSRSPVYTAGGITLEVEATVGATTKSVTASLTEDTSERPLTVDTTTYRNGERLSASGTAEPGAVVALIVGSWGNNGSAEADASGRWRVTSSVPVDAPGQVSIEVSTGVENPRVITKTLTEDTSERPLTVDTTTYRAGDRLIVTGTAEARTYVGFRVAETSNGGTAQVDEHGRWSLTSRFPVETRGQVTVEVSTGSGDSTKTVTRTLDEDVSERLLTVDTTEYRVGQRATVSGTADPGALVGVWVIGTRDYATGNADSDGMWEITTNSAVTTSGGVDIEVTTGNGPTARSITRTLTDAAAAAKLAVTSDKAYTMGEKVTVTGTADPGAKIDLRDAKGIFLRTLTADTTGHWTFTTGGAYTQDSITWKFVSGDETITETFTGKAASGPKLTVTSAKSYQKGEKVTVTGTAAPGAKIELQDAKGVFLRTLTADATGRWTFTTGGAYTQDTITWKFISGGTTITETFTGN